MSEVTNAKYLDRIKNKLSQHNITWDEFFETFTVNKNGLLKEDTAQHCLCGHSIKNVYYATRQSDNTKFMVGICCAKRFKVNQNKICESCDQQYTSNNMLGMKVCKPCRLMNLKPWKQMDAKVGFKYSKRIMDLTFTYGLRHNRYWLSIYNHSTKLTQWVNDKAFKSQTEINDYAVGFANKLWLDRRAKLAESVEIDSDDNVESDSDSPSPLDY